MSGPLKNEKSRQILPKSRNLAQPTIGSRILRFCVCRPHICFSIKSLNFSVSVSDFKMPVSASRRVSDLPFATPIYVLTAQLVKCGVLRDEHVQIWHSSIILTLQFYTWYWTKLTKKCENTICDGMMTPIWRKKTIKVNKRNRNCFSLWKISLG